MLNALWLPPVPLCWLNRARRGIHSPFFSTLFLRWYFLCQHESATISVLLKCQRNCRVAAPLCQCNCGIKNVEPPVWNFSRKGVLKVAQTCLSQLLLPPPVLHGLRTQHKCRWSLFFEGWSVPKKVSLFWVLWTNTHFPPNPATYQVWRGIDSVRKRCCRAPRGRAAVAYKEGAAVLPTQHIIIT